MMRHGVKVGDESNDLKVGNNETFESASKNVNPEPFRGSCNLPWSKEELAIGSSTLQSLEDKEILTGCKRHTQSEKADAIVKDLQERGYFRTAMACKIKVMKRIITASGPASDNNLTGLKFLVKPTKPKKTSRRPEITVAKSTGSSNRKTPRSLQEDHHHDDLLHSDSLPIKRPRLVTSYSVSSNNDIQSDRSDGTQWPDLEIEPSPEFKNKSLQGEFELGIVDNSRRSSEPIAPNETSDPTLPTQLGFPQSPILKVAHAIKAGSTAAQYVKESIKYAELERGNILTEGNEHRKKIRDGFLALKLVEAKLTAKEQEIAHLENVLKRIE